MKTAKLTVITDFQVTTTKEGEVWAKKGDNLVVSIRDHENYNIHKINDKNIYSRWMRRNWVNAKCK